MLSSCSKYSFFALAISNLYEALSCVWASPNDTVDVFVNDHALSVTTNLYASLLKLRHYSLERIVWADAICINQTDQNEKSHQIQSMAKIYGQVSRVIVWLGEESRQ